jgi:hypothetical protein
MSVAARRGVRATRLAEWAAPALAVVGAALLVIQWSHGRMLWLDEEMIAINIRDRSLAALAGRLSLGQAAPYGWLVLQRAALLTAGSGERALRFAPMAFGIATLGVAVWIGRRWMTPWGATALVFLCAFGQWISFHALELKHYSADVCFGLLLPALAAWAVARPFVTGLTPDNCQGNCQGSDPLQMRRRTAIWWGVAAASQWVSNGALFVAPPSALLIVAVTLRRFGWREAVHTAAPGVVWLGSFAANYIVALGPARSSDFLRTYWLSALPPAGADVWATVAWLGSQVGPLAIKPGGSGFATLFWTAAIAGFAFARASVRTFAAAFALTVIAAFAWAGARLVPMSERLTLWMVPALYVGIALAFDRIGVLLVESIRERRVVRLVAGLGATAAFLVLFSDLYTRGLTYLHLEPPVSNHELDDRAAIGWLAKQQRAGDVWIAAWNALPAIWWYATPVQAPIVVASYTQDAGSCRRSELASWLAAAGRHRALVYFGFGHDIPVEFDDLLMTTLTGVGQVVGYRRFASLGHAVIVDLGAPSTTVVTLRALSGRLSGPPGGLIRGCIVAAPGREW